MKSPLISLLALVCSACVARADTITWTYFTGWDHGFVLTVDREFSSISLHDRKTDSQRKTALHNSEDIFQYLAALMRRVKSDSIGLYADDGPENRIVLTDEKGTVKHTIYDVSPPNLFLHYKIQDPPFPSVDALKQADIFLKEADAFLFLNQLEELKKSYFEESSLIKG